MAAKTTKSQEKLKSEGLALGGTILVILGFLFLGNQLFNANLFHRVWPYAWPVALILCGLIILVKRYRRA